MNMYSTLRYKYGHYYGGINMYILSIRYFTEIHFFLTLKIQNISFKKDQLKNKKIKANCSAAMKFVCNNILTLNFIHKYHATVE